MAAAATATHTDRRAASGALVPEAITEQRKEKPQGDKSVKTSGQLRGDSLYNSCLAEMSRGRFALLCVTIGGWCLVQKADGLCTSFLANPAGTAPLNSRALLETDFYHIVVV